MKIPGVGRAIRHTVLAGILASAAGAQTHQAKMLVLWGASPGVPPQRLAARALRTVLADNGSKIATFEDFVDYTWISDTSSRVRAGVNDRAAALRDYLARKYAGIHFDVIFTAGPEALAFYRRYRDTLFPNVPVVSCIVWGDIPHRLAADSLVTVLTDSIDLAGTVRLALRLQPDTRRIAVVNGTAPSDTVGTAMARIALAPMGRRVAVDYLVGRAPEDLERSVARLPPHSIILFGSYRGDVSGRQYVTQDIMGRLSAVAAAPIYTWNDVQMGEGIVGGNLVREDSSVVRAARVAIRIAGGEPLSRWPRHLVNPTVVMVDWRQLKRWGISESAVPAGTLIAYRESTVWTRYRDVIMAALALFLAQAVVIALLVIQRGRRRRVERENGLLLDQLKASYDDARHFAVRLIAAQEAERMRIGRELHDDVNQKLAALSIDLSRFRHKVSAGASHLSDDFNRIEQAARNLVTDVRQISHQLHSGVLQHGGLVAALRSLCLEFADRHEVITSIKPAGDVDSVPPEVALCLYRSAQEALRNVATHAKARDVSLAVARGRDNIVMTVVDDGIGFDASGPRATSGLGLTSMGERVRALEGSAQIISKPGAGTTVRMTIPLSPALAPPPVAAPTDDDLQLTFEVHDPRPSAAPARSAR